MHYRMLSIKEISKLRKRSLRDELGVILIEGKKMISEALLAQQEIAQILTTEHFFATQNDFLESLGVSFQLITRISDHHAALIADTVTPSGIFAVLKKKDVVLDDILAEQFVVVLDGVRDPGNVGTMIRTADWFGVKAIVSSSESADFYNDKVMRATMGSLFHTKLYTSPDLPTDVETLKQHGFTIVVTRPEAAHSAQKLKGKIALIMGSESTGTSAEIDHLADATYAIPKFGQAESLNVAVSFGIILNELSATRK